MAKKGVSTIIAVVLAIILLVVGLVIGLFTASYVLPAPEKIEYTIGLAIAVSGPYAVDGPNRRDAALLGVEHMNDLLEAAGSPVTFVPIHEDSKGTTEGALLAFEALTAAGAKVVVGPLSSGEVGAIKSFCDDNKIVSISPSSTSAALAVPNDYVFRMPPTDIPQAKALSQLLGELNYTDVAIIGRNDDYGKGIANMFEDLFETNYGGTVEKLLYTVPAADYATEVGELSTTVATLGVAPTTAVMIIAFDDDGLNILTHAKDYPTTLGAVKWFGSESLKRPSFIPPAAPTAIGGFLVSVELTGLFPTPSKGPVVTAFEEAYKAKYNRDPTPYCYFAYDAARVACMSVLTAAEYDGEVIAKALPKVCENYLGASGYKKLDANGDCAGANYVVWKVVLEAAEYKFKDIGIWDFATEKLTFY